MMECTISAGKPERKKLLKLLVSIDISRKYRMSTTLIQQIGRCRNVCSGRSIIRIEEMILTFSSFTSTSSPLPAGKI